MNPKEAVSTMSRLGTMPPKARILKTVHCNTKQTKIKIHVIMPRFIGFFSFPSFACDF